MKPAPPVIRTRLSRDIVDLPWPVLDGRHGNGSRGDCRARSRTTLALARLAGQHALEVSDGAPEPLTQRHTWRPAKRRLGEVDIRATLHGIVTWQGPEHDP